MVIDRVHYIDGFIVYQNYQFFNEVTRDPDFSRHIVQECHFEAEAKRICETFNAENPLEETYYYEPGKILD